VFRIGLIFIFLTQCLFAQTINHTILHAPFGANSLYDVVMDSNNNIQAFGENGCHFQLKKSDDAWQIIDSASSRYTVYETMQTQQKLIALCDSTSVVALNENATLNEKINTNTPNHLLYCGIAHQQKYYVGSMRTAIASAKKVIPFGRIYTLNLDWKCIDQQKYCASAIWDFYIWQNKVHALKYTPLGTRLLANESGRWKKKKFYRYMLYRGIVQDSTIIYCGSKNFRRPYGIVLINELVHQIPQTNMIWDVAIMGKTIVAVGSKGTFFYKTSTMQHFKMIDLSMPQNLYDVQVINEKELIAVGQNGLIVLLKID
jgi:hypothetical protein